MRAAHFPCDIPTHGHEVPDAEGSRFSGAGTQDTDCLDLAEPTCGAAPMLRSKVLPSFLQRRQLHEAKSRNNMCGLRCR